MQKLTSSGAVQPDYWHVIDKNEALDLQAFNDKNCLIHVTSFLAHSDSLLGNAKVGVWLDSDDDANLLAPYTQHLAVIGIHFPVFMDGRGFSHARILKSQLGFSGELLAIGAFMQDQLFYLKRCGFDAFRIDDDANVESMRVNLGDFQHTYQASADDPRPIYRKRGLAV
jgi:uncharacterized protein (DUF934 family)